MRLKIAILGATGIGKFHVRDFYDLGCKIVAILGSSKETADKAAKTIGKKIGYTVKPYWNLDLLLKNENLNIVSVCTPPKYHYQMVKKCLEKNINVFCEKPLVTKDIFIKTQELLNVAKNKNKLLMVNTQWSFVIDKIYIPKKIDNFTFESKPGLKGESLLLDHLPHANSILVKLIPDGRIKKIIFSKKKEEEISVRFSYYNYTNEVKVLYKFKFKKERPRKIRFIINKESFLRKIGKNYSQSLILNNGECINIGDPFKESLRSFFELIQNPKKSAIEKEILENAILQEKILREYKKFINIK